MKRQNNNDKRGSNIPENNPSKAMDSKREVEQSPDNKTDQDFPGYPHYPAKEDIMDQRTDTKRVDMDMEELSNAKNRTGVSQRYSSENEEEQRSSRANPQQENDEFSDLNPRTPASNDSLETTNSRLSEIGIPQNVENSDLDRDRPGTDLNEAATDADVSREERMALENMYMPTNDEENLRRSRLDNTDFDGDELNEGSFGEVLSSAELDIPGEVDETLTTSMGQGDEENKYYSLGGDRQESNDEDPYSGPVRGNEA
ncbi:hypothetical protein [Flavisolibacter tropicus]|uniref:Uncharacterized protein n=1 Tax=Flavisolibacter tropicus TaxID=1492898 RepID=A0A172TU12_9BACT|nr:hypothetical protein [Flavisolibacter tropicus]ANE50237.1 hypothetical protein SY85_06705 [Flavisolibacter tropicus]